ncbi:MAG: hypothetical protein K8S87_01370 [Planctomycetes bacterium]|nr:hypothetical protein [Planctomycetota bacterium]
MKMKTSILIVVLFAFLLLCPINAETTLRKITGEEIKGEIIKLENGVVKIRTNKGEVSIPLAELDNNSKYTVQKQFIGINQPDAHLKLAEFCIEKQLYQEAIVEIKLAGESSDKLLKNAYEMLVKARLLHADNLRVNAKKKYAEKKFLDALNLYKTLYREYADAKDKEETEKEIKRLQAIIGRPDDVLPKQEPMPSLLLRNFEGKKLPNNADDDNVELPNRDKNRLEKETKKFDYTVKLIDEAWKLKSQAALKNATNEFVQKKTLYKNAEKKLNEAIIYLDELIRLPEKYKFLQKLVYDAKKTKSGATDRMIEIAKDMMYLYSNLSKPDLQMALRWLNKVLAYSPFDEDARQLRKTITESILKAARK